MACKSRRTRSAASRNGPGEVDTRSVTVPSATACLVSVHVGRPRALPSGRSSVMSAIFKHPVEGRVAVRGANLAGDEQADLSVHGGPDKAVYAYAIEEVLAWQGELGRDLGEAAFGQNLTTQGVDVSGAVIGERWRVGTTLLEVAQPRLPCFKLGLRVGEPGFVKWFAQASRPGAYLRIIEPGDLGAGDPVEVVSRPDHAVTSRMVADALLRDATLIPLVLTADQLPGELRSWLARRITD